MSGQTEETALVEVRIVGMPLEVYRDASQHTDELMREFALIREGQRSADDGASVPDRLLDLINELSGRFGTFTGPQTAELARALERGDATIDLVYRVPAAAKEAAMALRVMLEEADDFCRAGTELLTLATPPRAVAFRNWFLDQFVIQIEGGPPTSWEDAAP